MRVVEQHRDSLSKPCQAFNVDKMYLFGSALGSKFTDKSDLDFLVKFKPIELSEYFDNYIGFKENLESLFKRKVDLLEEQALRNPILINSINNSKEIVYGWTSSKKWFFDIKIAINEIELFVENEGKDFSKYQKNLMLKRAVERNLEIIGEAVNRILKHDPEIASQITNFKAIISLRNQVIHAYDNISGENIWQLSRNMFRY